MTSKGETSMNETWNNWNGIDTFLLLTAILLFSLNITCLIIIYLKLQRKIDARVCQRCIKEPEPSQLICEPMKESSLAISPIILAEGDSETDSSDTSDYPDTEEKQGLSKTRTVTYTTVHFDNKKQLPDYENIVETPDYVNVHIKGANDKNKKQKKKVQSVDYTIVAPMPVPFRRPSHLQATATDSSSS